MDMEYHRDYASRARHPGTGTWRRGPSQRPLLGAIGARRYEYSPDTSPAAGLLHGTVPRTARFTSIHLWMIPRASPGHSALELPAVACVGAVIALRDNALALPLPPNERLWYFVFPRSCHTNSRYLIRAPVASSAAPGLSAVLLEHPQLGSPSPLFPNLSLSGLFVPLSPSRRPQVSFCWLGAISCHPSPVEA
ncbi:hypothetical protein TsFJ059_006355 [Trichoderma semiorbis]|uniref:Uncharacterized protein n=1 Tax=Trichoderma semiorbis TaxID=1491008 RepID=A0A9P8HJA9_9HYPO|nr:hypothetical protein TsFJ059_006355 [Trichoderma semiorbis]